MSRMSLDTAIRLSAEVKGGGNIDRVKRSLQDLGKSAEVTKQQKTALRTATLAYARSNDQTLGGIRNSITALRGLQEQARIGSREFSRYGAEIQRLERNLRGIDEPARRASANFAGIGAAAARLVVAYAGIETVRFIFGSAAQIESQVRSLEVLTGSADRARQIVEELQQLGAVTPFTSAELIDTARRLQAFGVEANEVVDITRRLADVSGATGAELAGLATAYGQVQAKGRLQGEELLQFQERGVALQQVLRKEYGLSAEEFQKALEGGKISAEAVEFALKKLTDTGGKYANGAIAQSDTLNGRFSTLSDSVQVLAQTIGNSLEPVFKWALSQATAVVTEIQRLIDEANNAGGARDREAQFARNADAAVRAMGLNPFTQQGMMADMRQRNIEQQRADFNLSRQNARAAGAPPSPVGSAPPPLTGGTRAGGAAGGGSGGSRSGSAPSFQPSSRARALMAAAQKLGVSPLDLATIISFETGGTFSPSIRGGAGGNYMGLIQFGGPERRQYGANPGQSFEEQVTGPVVRYFQDRFGKVGMSTQGASLEDLYTTVLAGNPKANRNSRDSFGTSPRSGVARMGPHRQKALQMFFGGSMDNVGFDSLDQAQANNEGFEAQQQQQEQRLNTLNEQANSAERSKQETEMQLAALRQMHPITRQIVEAENDALRITQAYADQKAKIEEAAKGATTEAENKAKVDALAAIEADKKLKLDLNAAKLSEQLTKDSASLTGDLEKLAKDTGDRLAYEREYADLLRSGMNPETARQTLELNKIVEATKINLEQRIKILQASVASLSAESEVRKEIEKQIELLERKRKATDELAESTRRDIESSTVKSEEQKIEDQIASIKEELTEMTSLANQAAFAAQTISDAFAGSFRSILDGSKSTREALADFFKSIADNYMQMAVDIIAKQMQMLILQTILNAIGGAATGGGGGGGGGGTSNIPSSAPANSMPNLSGAAFPGRAVGGPVSAGRAHPVGERGPELFVPYQSGTIIPADVTKALAAANTAAQGPLMVPFQAGNSSAAMMRAGAAASSALSVPFQAGGGSGGNGLSVPFLKGADGADGATGAGGSIMVDVKSTVINSVEYVTVDQLRASTQEAARRGAALAEKRVRNNPSVRRGSYGFG